MVSLAQFYKIIVSRIVIFIPKLICETRDTPKWAIWYENLIQKIIDL